MNTVDYYICNKTITRLPQLTPIIYKYIQRGVCRKYRFFPEVFSLNPSFSTRTSRWSQLARGLRKLCITVIINWFKQHTTHLLADRLSVIVHHNGPEHSRFVSSEQVRPIHFSLPLSPSIRPWYPQTTIILHDHLFVERKKNSHMSVVHSDEGRGRG